MGDDVAGNQFKPTDPYARRQEAVKDPPAGFLPTLRHLGPGLILVGSVVGSGEIVLTTTLGAKVGFAMLWWILLSCWGKNIVQAELGRHTISSGESSLQAFNQLPGPRWRGSSGSGYLRSSRITSLLVAFTAHPGKPLTFSCQHPDSALGGLAIASGPSS